jgi:hypothetical protein
MLKKTILIDGKEVEFKASASIPRLYRIKFRRDIMQDMIKLQKAYIKSETEGKEFEFLELETFENVSYIMAKHANPDIPSDIFDWLDEFNTFSIYEVLPEILEMWALNEESQIETKKNLNKVAGK